MADPWSIKDWDMKGIPLKAGESLDIEFTLGPLRVEVRDPRPWWKRLWEWLRGRRM
jgi:hypothetical protein